MARKIENTFPGWLRYFDSIDSTNNYAMRLVDDGLAQHGDVIWAGLQANGKGQRGKKWEDDPGNIKMSLIVKPVASPEQQFILSMQVAVTIAKYLQTLYDQWQVAIKWPNDIYINDKKACGILIENVFRGMSWMHAVIGIGLNVNQTSIVPELTHATSLLLASGRTFDLQEIVTDLRSGILNLVSDIREATQARLLQNYNDLLHRKNKETRFADRDSGKQFDAFVTEVNAAGELVLLTTTGIRSFRFGQLEWLQV